MHPPPDNVDATGKTPNWRNSMAAKTMEKLCVFEQIKSGLEDSLAHSRGEFSLPEIVVTLPSPPPTPR